MLKIAASGISVVLIPAWLNSSAVWCPASDGPLSATTTSNFRFRAAAFRNSATVCECPNVMITSLE
jgi:hypothetical protein